MFDNLYIEYSHKRLQVAPVENAIEDSEQMCHVHMPPAQIEELPQGLIGDEL